MVRIYCVYVVCVSERVMCLLIAAMHADRKENLPKNVLQAGLVGTQK